MKKKFSPIFSDFPHIIHGGDYNPDQWLHMPQILSEDLRLMPLAGMNSATLAIFAWSALEPEEGVYRLEWLDKIVNDLYERGIYTVLATPSGARPAWLDERYPETMRTRNDGIKELHGRRHNHCMSSPLYREKVRKIDTVLAEHFKGNPAVKLWHISNEFSGECFCPLCRENFRKFLRKKYHDDINELNEQWWNAFWSHTFNSFEQIEPPMSMGENSVMALELDWKRFITEITCDFMREEIKTLKAITPDIPVTTNMMGTYEGLNYWKMSQYLDVASWDSYPQFGNPSVTDSDLAVEFGLRHDLTRSFLKKPFMLMESTPSCVNWQYPTNKAKRPGIHYLSSMQVIGHGSDTIQYFQWRKSRGSEEKFHGAVVDHEGSENSRVFKEVARLGNDLKKLDEIVGTDTEAKVAIIYDWEINWAVKGFKGYNVHRNYEKTVREFYRCFFNHAINVDFLPIDGDFSGYTAVIAPMIYSIPQASIDKLEEYVRGGGILVSTYLSGYTNENDLCYLGGFPGSKLRKVFGIWVEETDAPHISERIKNEYSKNELSVSGSFESFDFCDVIHLEGARELARYKSEYYAETPSVTLNSYGKGKAYYIGTRQAPNELEKLMKAIIDAESIRRTVPDTLPEGVKVVSRTDYEHEYIFVTNYNTEEKLIDIGENECVDLLSGQRFVGKAKIAPLGVLVLKRAYVNTNTTKA